MSDAHLYDVLLYGGGECFERFGVPFWRLNGAQAGYGTFTRSGSVGPLTGADGVLRAASANRLRTEWEYNPDTGLFDSPALLVEGGTFTNLVDEDDISAWSAHAGTPVITTGIDDPAGGTSAVTVADDNTGSVEIPYRAISFPQSGDLPVVFVVRENTPPSGGGSNEVLGLYDNDAAVYRLELVVTAWTDGEPSITASTGTLVAKRRVGTEGWWAILGEADSVVHTNENRILIVPDSAGTQTASIDVYRVNTYGGSVFPWSILDASEAKNEEIYYEPWPYAPRAMCGMIDFRELENPVWSTGGLRLINIGTNSDPKLAVDRVASADTYRITHDTGSSSVSSTVDLDPSWGDRVQLFWWLYADGSVLIEGRKQALESTTWSSVTTGSQSAALAFGSAWSSARIYVNSVGSAGRGAALYRKLLALAGSGFTRDELLGVFA